MRFMSLALKELTIMAVIFTFILVNLIIFNFQINSSQSLLTHEEFLCAENYLPTSDSSFLKFVFFNSDFLYCQQ